MLRLLYVSPRILNEFEKAKQGYEDSLAAAKTSTLSKVLDKGSKQRTDKASANEEVSVAVGVLKIVVNEFLADPVNFKANDVPPKKVQTEKPVIDNMVKEGLENSKKQFSVTLTITWTTFF